MIGSAMGFIDGSAVNVALPAIQRELHASAQDGQWVVESYALFLSALLLVGGSLGDMFGRRLVFGAGVVVFALGSAACALAPSIEWLLAGRIVQGIGAAFATPGSLALISGAFEGAARGRAIGTWSGFSAMTAALGPVLGGWLVQVGSWRAVFVINLPLALVVLALLALRVEETRDPGAARRVDFAGALLATAGLGAVVYGLIRGQSSGASVVSLGAAAAGVALLGAFVALERREAHPMVRLDVFASRRFSAANLYTLFLYAALGGSLYFLPFDLIYARGYPPAAAGAVLLPFIAIMVVASRFSGGLVSRIGPRLPLVAGALLAAAGFTGFAIAGSIAGPYWATFFPAAVVLGCGGALFVAPLTTTVMESLEPAHAGIASGINNAVSRLAGLLAVAALGIVLVAAFDAYFASLVDRSALDTAARASALAHASDVLAGHLTGPLEHRPEGRLVMQFGREAYARGFSIVMVFSAGLSLIAALIACDRSFTEPRAAVPEA